MSFYNTLSDYYDVIFPSNEMQLSFITKYLQEQASILDIAAGTGNQAFALGKLDYEVTAIELSSKMVEKMKEKCNKGEKNVKPILMNMKEIDQFGTSVFDAVICIGNSIAHLANLQEIEEVLEKMYLVLKQGGVIIIQLVNFDRVLEENITELPVIERKNDGVTFIRTYKHSGNNIIFSGKLIVENENKQEIFQNDVTLFPLTSAQLQKSLLQCNFKEIGFFGNFKGERFNKNSPAIIAVAKN